MRELTILHTSDLCISPTNNFKDVLLRITDELAERNLKERVDYLIISGNITADGSVESFQEAQELILTLAETVLRHDDGALQLLRILIVPGWRDVLATRDFTNFATFHDRLFAAELGRHIEPFEPSGAIVRDLKDLTLIGITYWRSHADLVPRNLHDVRQAISTARQQVARLEYTNQTPTVLVSASDIAFDGRSESLQSFTAIQSDLKIHLKTTLQLFGSGEAPAILPSPMGFHHVAIGTGARATEFWPCTMNVLELKREALEGDHQANGTHFMTSRIFQMLTAESPLLEMSWLSGEVDTFYRRLSVKVNPDTIYGSLLQQLEDHLQPGAAIALMGFPGAGKSILFDYLVQRTTLVNRKIAVIPLTVYRYDDFPHRLQSALDAFRAQKTETEAMPLLLIHDLWFGRLPISEKYELTNAILGADGKDDPRKLIAGLSVLILLTTADVSPAPFTVLPLPPLKAQAVTNLARDYAKWTPIDAAQLRALAGGYVGFSKLLLKAASDWFEGLSGAQPIGRDMPSTVMQEALFASTVAMKSQLHRANLQLVTAGEEVCRHIEAQIDDLQPTGMERLNLASLPTVHVDLSQIEDRYRADRPKALLMRKAVRHLHWAGILSNDETSTSSRYIVRVPAPFLSIRGVRERRDPIDEWPAISSGDMKGPIDVLIVSPLPKERDAVLARLPNHQRVDVGDKRVYYYAKVPVTFPGGHKGMYRVVVMNLDGPGEVEAAVATGTANERWNPTAVMLVGIAGGVKAAGVAHGDVLIADKVAYSGLQKIKPDFAEIRWEMDHVDRELHRAVQNFSAMRWRGSITAVRPEDGTPERYIGPMVTGDNVIASEHKLKEYLGIVPKLIGVEMEAWGVMRAIAEKANRAFLMIRGVSDLADASKDDRWHEYACDVAATYTVELLRTGPFRPEKHQREQQ